MHFFKITLTAVACFMSTMVSADDNTGNCTNPLDDIAPLFFLNGPDFANVCIATNITSEPRVVSSFNTCCGSNPVFNIGDGCYTYCNITVGAPQSKWLSCFKNSPGVSSNMVMFDCFNGTTANLTAIPFTSSLPTASIVPLDISSGSPQTSTMTGSASASSSTTNSITSGSSQTSTMTGSASASSSTTKASKAGHAIAAGGFKEAFMAIALVLVGHYLA